MFPEILVDKTLNLSDIGYNVIDVFIRHTCVVAAEYEDTAFHIGSVYGARLWWK